MRTRTAAALAAALGATHAAAQQAFEVSEDARSIAFPSLAEPAAPLRAGDEVPYALTPDWSYAARRQIGGLQIADMNNDTLPDLVAVCYSSSSFPPYTDWHDMVFYNTGDGLEATPSWISTPHTHSGDVQVADVNADTLPDLVITHGGSIRADSVHVHFNTGSGPDPVPGYTSSVPGGAWGTSAAVFDFDHDGDIDVLTTNQGISPNPFRPMYLFGNNAGVLSPTPTWQSAESSIQSGLGVGDYDNDGWEDVAVAKWINWESGVYRNVNGTLATTPAWTTEADGADKGAAMADFNGDGSLDAAFGGDPATIWHGDAEGDFALAWTSTAPLQSAQDFRAQDFDHDGDTDLADIHFSTGRAHLYLNRDGVLDTEPSWTFDAPEVGSALAFGDINADGRTDLVLGFAGDTSIRVFLALPPACPADIDDNGVLNLDDVEAFTTAFSGGSLDADLDDNGVLNLDDVEVFVTSFASGCP